MSETALWLIPLLPACVLAVIIGVRTGLRWTWGLCLQQSIIIVAILAGFFLLYAPQQITGLSAGSSEHAANICAWISWALFLLFNIIQRVVLNRFALDLSLMRISEARKKAGIVRALAWGPPGQYWNDLALALSFYHQGDTADGDAIIDQWQKDPRMPAPSKDSLGGFAMLGRVMQNDWDAITTLYDEGLVAHHKVPAVPPQLAARAFAEQHRFDDSLHCLRFLNAQPTRVPAVTIDLNFIPFFALSGACGRLQDVLNNCVDRQALPDYARVYWRARCAASQGKSEEALRLLGEAKAKAPAHLSVWHDRIDKQMHDQQAILAGLQPAKTVYVDERLVSEAYHDYHNWRLAADLLRPARSGPGMLCMFWLIIAAFLVTDAFDVFHSLVPQDLLVSLAYWKRHCYSLGELNTDVWSGQWWRLVSYMFLHGNTAHLMLNAAGLFFFGRTVENMYGTSRFLIIYFGAGIASGVFQLLMIPGEAAVGASGAILGVFGAVIAGIIKLKDVLPKKVRQSELRFMLSIAAAQVVFDQVVNNLAAATDKSGSGIRIAAFAHAGGILAGFVLGMLLPLRSRKRP